MIRLECLRCAWLEMIRKVAVVASCSPESRDSDHGRFAHNASN
jgi:hypothetical protein